jgi:TetR/AcrR family transcriptional regulator, lmrAB and yxaGH operons repressor
MAPAQKHREGLVAAATALFRRQGYAATGLAEILAESGAPKGSLYHYFPDGKEAVGEAALRWAYEKMGGAMLQLAADNPDPRDFIRAYSRAAAAELENSAFREGCALATITLEAVPQSSRITSASLDAFNGWSRMVARSLRHVGIAPDRAKELAELIISSCEGALILARVRQDAAPILRVAEELVRVVDNELQPSRSV